MSEDTWQGELERSEQSRKLEDLEAKLQLAIEALEMIEQDCAASLSEGGTDAMALLGAFQHVCEKRLAKLRGEAHAE